jgi:hypothetical protein
MDLLTDQWMQRFEAVTLLGDRVGSGPNLARSRHPVSRTHSAAAMS